MNYEQTANELTNRILKLIPEQPQILAMDNPWDLFKIPGFECGDIGPSLAQASHALREAQWRYKALVEAL